MILETNKLKKKYSKLPDSNNLSTATKRKSLKGKPLSKRLIFGGTFQIDINQNPIININPEIGYRMDKNLTLGIGATYDST